MPHQGPKGSPVNPLAFLGEPEAAPAQAKNEQEVVSTKPEAQVLSVDSPEYAAAIVNAIQVQPDVEQVLGKLGALDKALNGGHDIKEVLSSVIAVVSQSVAVMAVKHLDAMAASQGDPDAVEAIEQLGGILDEIREIVGKIPMGSAQKGQPFFFFSRM